MPQTRSLSATLKIGEHSDNDFKATKRAAIGNILAIPGL
jgi:hypothetical protein